MKKIFKTLLSYENDYSILKMNTKLISSKIILYIFSLVQENSFYIKTNNSTTNRWLSKRKSQLIFWYAFLTFFETIYHLLEWEREWDASSVYEFNWNDFFKVQIPKNLEAIVEKRRLTFYMRCLFKRRMFQLDELSITLTLSLTQLSFSHLKIVNYCYYWFFRKCSK